MLRRIAGGLLLVLSSIGCNKPTPTGAEPSNSMVPQIPSSNSPGTGNPVAAWGKPGASMEGSGSGGAVQAVRGAVVRTANLNQMKDLHLFLENASGASDSGRLPSVQQTLEILKGHPDGLVSSRLIAEGAIVLVGNPSRESLWAYTKDAPSIGGIAISSSGVERMTADEIKRRLK